MASSLAGAEFERVHVRAALIKVCLAYEHGVLPANLHFTQPNPNSASLNAGILKVLPTDTLVCDARIHKGFSSACLTLAVLGMAVSPANDRCVYTRWSAPCVLQCSHLQRRAAPSPTRASTSGRGWQMPWSRSVPSAGGGGRDALAGRHRGHLQLWLWRHQRALPGLGPRARAPGAPCPAGGAQSGAGGGERPGGGPHGALPFTVAAGAHAQESARALFCAARTSKLALLRPCLRCTVAHGGCIPVRVAGPAQHRSFCKGGPHMSSNVPVWPDGDCSVPQVVIPVVARTTEGAKELLRIIEGRGAAAAELAAPLKRQAPTFGSVQASNRAQACNPHCAMPLVLVRLCWPKPSHECAVMLAQAG